MPRIQFVHDSSVATPCAISTYMHCTRCLEERPSEVSPADWSRTQIGITRTGALQVWCNRHDLNVDLITVQIKNEEEVIVK